MIPSWYVSIFVHNSRSNPVTWLISDDDGCVWFLVMEPWSHGECPPARRLNQFDCSYYYVRRSFILYNELFMWCDTQLSQCMVMKPRFSSAVRPSFHHHLLRHALSPLFILTLSCMHHTVLYAYPIFLQSVLFPSEQGKK